VDSGTPPFNDLIEALHTLTTVRALIASGLSSGLRNDAPDGALSMRQKWRLAEIRCEDYAFMLLSRMVNLVENQVGRRPRLAALLLCWSKRAPQGTGTSCTHSRLL
jgi:hypothetical protein